MRAVPADERQPAVIGVDVGGTKVAVAKIEGREAVAAKQVPTPLDSTEALVGQIEQTVREVIDETEQPEAVGIGLPSQIDFNTGTIVASVNIPLEGVPLGKQLSDKLDGIPVYVDNDANAAALAEAHFIDDGPARHLVMYTLGTGVGGGVVIDGSIFRGASGLGAELGHAVINLEGPNCPGTCPNRGCLEALCSGMALERDATEFAKDHPGTRLGTFLGVGLAGAINTFEPEHIVIGGGLSAGADFFLDRAIEEARGRALPAAAERVQIGLAQAGPEAGLIGAGLLALQEVEAGIGDTAGATTRRGDR